MTEPAKHWTGRNSKVKFFLHGKEIVIDVMRWNVKRVGTRIDDGICGEDRNRNGFLTNGYDISFTAQTADLKLLNAFLAEQRADDNGEVQKETALGFFIYARNATVAAYQAREVSTLDWDFGVDGNNDRNKMQVPLAARYFDPLPTA